MDFYEVLDQVINLLRSRGRVSYRALQRQFDLDPEYVEDLKVELIDVQELALDRDGKMLVWTGEPGPTSEPVPTPSQPAQQSTTQDDQPPQAEPPTPDAERRQLTVMFCDLADSTKLSGQLDPEDYRDVIRAYQATCAEVMQPYEAFVAQHLGDGVLVYFGFPQAHEDDAQRAVRAGLAIIDAMGPLNTRLEREKNLRLTVRIGIHTGPVVVGAIGGGDRQELLALGEVPNIASRVQGIAAPNTVAISADTYRLVEGYFDCDDLGLHTLMGVARPMQVYRVLQASGAQSRLDIVTTRGLIPLVGREQEVGLLRERWEQMKHGQGQVVLLSGEGGIGKSRLVQVLKQHVAGEPHTLQECRCSPYHTQSAFFPLIDLLRRKLHWQSEDTPDAKLHKLETVLAQTHLDVAKAVPLFTPLLALPLPDDCYPTLSLSSQRQRQQTMEAMLKIFLEAAAQHPVVFIVEDLHWVDPSTLEFLDLLFDQVPTAAILALLTCRPAFHHPWSSHSYLTQITLSRLSRLQVEQFVEGMTDGKTLPAEIMQQLQDKTDGVPLFVEEMTKAVLESGALKEVNGQYELVGSFASLAIPSTLQDSLMARLDRLMTAKVIAQLGATIGRQFSYALLRMVAQVDEATLQRELGRLVEAELVYQRGLPPQAMYIFKHALIQDAAYQSLLRSTRQHYHQRIAQVLEERFPETIEMQPELLAHHYTEAGLHVQAVRYWQQAGEHALGRSFFTEAIGHLTKGLEVLTTLPDTAERTQDEFALRVALGDALRATKGFAAPDVEHEYTRAYALCQRLGDTPRLFRVLRGLRQFYLMRGVLPTACEVGEHYLSLAQRQQDATAVRVGHFLVGLPLFYLGELPTARVHLEQGGGNTSCPAWHALLLWHLGYPDQAHQTMHEALTQQLPNPLGHAVVLMCASMFHQLCREWDVAQQRAEAVMDLGTEHELTLLLTQGTLLHGRTLVTPGQAAEGVEQMHQGLAAYLATGAEAWHAMYLGMLAAAYEQVGQAAEGLRQVAEALEVVEATQERWWEPELYRLRGALLLDVSPDNHADAEVCFHRALDVARHQQAKSWELRAATSLARLWQQQDNRDEARELLAEVYHRFTEGFDTADLQEAKALLEELEG